MARMAGSALPVSERLISSFRADPNRTFSEDEIAILAAVAEEDVWAAKAAAVHHFRNRQFEPALGFARGIAAREPDPENLKNAAVALRSLGRHREAIEWIELRADAFDPIEREDLLCSLHQALGHTERAIAHGDSALKLKDEAAPASIAREPIVHRFDPGARGRNVIAFSIWGDDPRYLNGAVTNAIVARYLYPGWTARFYTDRSTPQHFRDALVQHGAQLRLVDELPAASFGRFWRFLPEDDPEVDIYLVRDADAVMNVRERWAVADWLNSGKAFHVMRDHPQHSELILAGLWGAHRGNIGGMEEKIRESVRAGGRVGNYLTNDQHFLRNVVWPVARASVKIHDEHFSFMSPTRFSPDFPLPRPMHVGQNDWVNFRRGDRKPESSKAP
jgi:tetratricopeptide (TPR) repeat protein